MPPFGGTKELVQSLLSCADVFADDRVEVNAIGIKVEISGDLCQGFPCATPPPQSRAPKVPTLINPHSLPELRGDRLRYRLFLLRRSREPVALDSG